MVLAAEAARSLILCLCQLERPPERRPARTQSESIIMMIMLPSFGPGGRRHRAGGDPGGRGRVTVPVLSLITVTPPSRRRDARRPRGGHRDRDLVAAGPAARRRRSPGPQLVASVS